MLRPPLMHSQSCKSPADQQASKRWATHARHEGGNQRRVASKSGCSAFDLMAALPNLGQMQLQQQQPASRLQQQLQQQLQHLMQQCSFHSNSNSTISS